MQVFMKHNKNAMQCKGYIGSEWRRTKKYKFLNSKTERAEDWENDKWFDWRSWF